MPPSQTRPVSAGAEGQGGLGGLERSGTEEMEACPTLHRPLPGRPFSPKDLLNKAVSNVIASLTFGFRFEYNDPRIVKLLDLMEDMLKEESGLVRQVRDRSSVEAASVLQQVPPPEEDLCRGPVQERAFQDRHLQGKGLEVGDGRQPRWVRPGGGQRT